MSNSNKRPRTSQMCDSCRKRRHKCNGLNPCDKCTMRSLVCTWAATSAVSDSSVFEKGQKAKSGGGPPVPLFGKGKNESGKESEQEPKPQVPTNNHSIPFKMPQSIDTPGKPRESVKPFLNPFGQPRPVVSERSVVEEAEIHSSTRMLQDPTGRLLYFGESATISFLQLIRMTCTRVCGPSPFTLDPGQHRIIEGTSSLPPIIRQTRLLPDPETARVLVGAYFTNIIALVEVFPQKWFMTSLDSCYADPLSVDPQFQCLLYLTFAIGLVMASPVLGSREFSIIQKLRVDNRAEMFYQDARNFSDPSTGFEDSGLWGIQALTLMSVYTLAVSKRNAAYAYHGMAVRSAFALGLHREESICTFHIVQQPIRRNLWRSLFVLDRFLSASLGRPTAIRESDCSGDTLSIEAVPPLPQAPFPTASNAGFGNAIGLRASVRSSHLIGVILDKVYSQRKFSTQLAQGIADKCRICTTALDPSLHWRQTNQVHPNQGIAILHVNLMHFHTILLLNRPFFLYLMNERLQEQRGMQHTQRHSLEMERFAEACVVASCESVELVQIAATGKYLPQQNPFVLYFLFTSALIIISNEFASLFNNPQATSTINSAINIISYCGQRDPQASRSAFILTHYRDLVRRRRASNPMPYIANSNVLGYGVDDPVGNLFKPTNLEGPEPNHTFLVSPQPPNMRSPDTPYLDRVDSSGSSNPTFSHASTLVQNSPVQTQFDPNSLPSHNNTPHKNTDISSMQEGVPQDGVNDAEIDFDMLWRWPHYNGETITPNAQIIGFTSDGSVGLVNGEGNSNEMGTLQTEIQGISDPYFPTYGTMSGGGGDGNPNPNVMEALPSGIEGVGATKFPMNGMMPGGDGEGKSNVMGVWNPETQGVSDSNVPFHGMMPSGGGI